MASNDTEEGKAANRRIEISMILKDDTVLDIVEDYLAIEPPDTELAPLASPFTLSRSLKGGRDQKCMNYIRLWEAAITSKARPR